MLLVFALGAFHFDEGCFWLHGCLDEFYFFGSESCGLLAAFLADLAGVLERGFFADFCAGAFEFADRGLGSPFAAIADAASEAAFACAGDCAV